MATLRLYKLVSRGFSVAVFDPDKQVYHSEVLTVLRSVFKDRGFALSTNKVIVLGEGVERRQET